MNNLRPFAFLALFVLTACTSTDNGKKNSITTDKPEQKTVASSEKQKTQEKAVAQQPKSSTDKKTTTKATTPFSLDKSTVKKSNLTFKTQLPLEQSKQIAGLYFARLPCPGCGKVRVNLVLEANQTYDKTEEYLASNEIFFDSGTWDLQDGTLILIPSQNTLSTIRLFRYEKGSLLLLTEQGRTYSGKPSDFRFKKK